MSEKPKVNIPLLGFALGLIATVAALALACVHNLTLKPIAEAHLKKTNQALKKVLPEFDNVPSSEKFEIKGKNGVVITFYPAKKNGKLVALAANGESGPGLGFNGPVTLMVGLDANGSVRTCFSDSSGVYSAVEVTAQNETPGLGTVVTDRFKQTTIWDILGQGKKVDPRKPIPNPILDQFAGKRANPSTPPWKVKKDGGDIDAITGATITSRAVTDAVFNIVSTFSKNKEVILEKSNGSADKKESALKEERGQE